MAVSYEIYSGESDQLGARRRIMSGARPGLIMRLNSGIYHIISRYGDANAVVNADVTVEAGKLTEVAITHPGATVTFRLVTCAGGEAQSGAQWAILDSEGEVIKESAGALPTHVLAAGSYVAPALLGAPGSRWFTQLIYEFFFEGGNWNRGAAYALLLLILCLIVVLCTLRLFNVKLVNVAK